MLISYLYLSDQYVPPPSTVLVPQHRQNHCSCCLFGSGRKVGWIGCAGMGMCVGTGMGGGWGGGGVGGGVLLLCVLKGNTSSLSQHTNRGMLSACQNGISAFSILVLFAKYTV